MKRIYKPPRLTALLVVLALLAALTCTALADTTFQAVVAVDSMKVYAQKAPHAMLGTLPRGTVVTVTAYSGSLALIAYNGKTGVARISDMTRASGDGGAEQTPESPSGTEMVANRDTRIYKRASTSSTYATVAEGTTVTLLAVKGRCAKVSLQGKVGYMVYSHLSEPGAQTPTPVPTATPTPEPVKTTNTPVVTTQQARVYARADFTGEYATLSAGTKLTLLATRGEVAMVERDGAIGYIPLVFLKKDISPTPTPTQAPTSQNPFAAGSNEHTIFAFLTGSMGYNRAAAMGVMANIKYESGYRPVISGDSGTSYGICQWHAGRKSNLINWCAENNLDYTTLEGQLKFLKYEITTRYTSVHNYLKQVDNTAEGAYDAGYYFCFNFEAPAARTSQSTKRGAYARDTLFPMR